VHLVVSDRVDPVVQDSNWPAKVKISCPLVALLSRGAVHVCELRLDGIAMSMKSAGAPKKVRDQVRYIHGTQGYMETKEIEAML
jgi:hypothetical protein